MDRVWVTFKNTLITCTILKKEEQIPWKVKWTRLNFNMRKYTYSDMIIVVCLQAITFKDKCKMIFLIQKINHLLSRWDNDAVFLVIVSLMKKTRGSFYIYVHIYTYIIYLLWYRNLAMASGNELSNEVIYGIIT